MPETCCGQAQVKQREAFFGFRALVNCWFRSTAFAFDTPSCITLHHHASPHTKRHQSHVIEEIEVYFGKLANAKFLPWVPGHHHNWHPPPSTGGLLRCWHIRRNAKERGQHCTSRPSCACAPAGCLKALARAPHASSDQ